MSKIGNTIINEIAEGFISKSSITIILRNLNNSSKSLEKGEDNLDRILSAIDLTPPRIQAEQETQGIEWLNNLRRSPTGKERKNNPFNKLEEFHLDNFSHFTLAGFKDLSNVYREFYVPLYRVNSTNEGGFNYYMAGGEFISE